MMQVLKVVIMGEMRPKKPCNSSSFLQRGQSGISVLWISALC